MCRGKNIWLPSLRGCSAAAGSSGLIPHSLWFLARASCRVAPTSSIPGMGPGERGPAGLGARPSISISEYTGSEITGSEYTPLCQRKLKETPFNCYPLLPWGGLGLSVPGHRVDKVLPDRVWPAAVSPQRGRPGSAYKLHLYVPAEHRRLVYLFKEQLPTSWPLSLSAPEPRVAQSTNVTLSSTPRPPSLQGPADRQARRSPLLRQGLRPVMGMGSPTQPPPCLLLTLHPG